ncbi:MAG: hypothetical protein LAQ30_20510 [Acidobacteriia bacterium]|nr:hypothetical protein [Terriglobia bacterium]
MKKCLGFVFASALVFGTASFAAQDNNNGNNNNNSKNKNYGSHEQVQNTKTTTDSGTMKTSSDRMFGKVEEYQLNKSIKITAPGKTEGSRTIDLNASDQTTKISPGVKVGDWVSVVEKTDKNGHKTVTVKPSKTAAREQTQTQQR